MLLSLAFLFGLPPMVLPPPVLPLPSQPDAGVTDAGAPDTPAAPAPEVKPTTCHDTGTCFVRVVFNARVDAKSVESAVAQLRAADAAGAQHVLLEINSLGGEVEAGFQLAKTVEDSRAHVVCLVDGAAESMGFYILQSCSERVMSKRSVLMTHQVRLGEIKDSQTTLEELHNYYADIRATSRAFGEHVSRRMNMPYDAYNRHVAGNLDWYMDWKAALKNRAVDDVIDDVKIFRADVAARVTE